ncbi:unnamed protein product [Phytophthora fragariaefolia]|uniref:Unnamed protein product n=1 Tax=Phytophthora fragariaefolia TaxID=1490495 RepID=A0A9W6TJP3_9STRA|nr:unnamed protein product [Phytophthora fragariaefolia]
MVHQKRRPAKEVVVALFWELPGWRALSAHGFILESVTVDDAEYHDLLKGMELMSECNVQDLVVVGDSRIVIQQVQGLINCNQPNLQRRLAEYEALTVKFKSVKLVHVKRDYNQAADYLTSKTLALGETWQVEGAEELRHLEQVSKIPEKLMKSEGSLNIPVHEESGQSPPDGVTRNDDRPGPEAAPLPTAARVMTAVVTRSRNQEEYNQGEPMVPDRTMETDQGTPRERSPFQESYNVPEWRNRPIFPRSDSQALQEDRTFHYG